MFSIINEKTKQAKEENKNKLYLKKNFFKEKNTHQSVPSGNFETWMLIQNTLKADYESKRKEWKEITIKGLGMKINLSENSFGRKKATE